MKKNNKNRRFKNSLVSLAITVAVAVLLVVINSIVGELSDRGNLSLDLTGNALYSLSDESAQYLDTLDKRVSIHVLTDENSLSAGNQYTTQIYQTLQAYAAFPRITVDYTDLTLNPTYIQNYPGYELSAGSVIVQCGERIYVTKLADMLNSETTIDYSTYSTSTTITNSAAEQILTNAVMFVSTEELTRISVLSGYSEVSTEALVRLFTGNSFDVVEQSLITEEIDPDAEVAVLYGVQSTLGEDALSKLERWLDNDGQQGKALLIFADPNFDDYANLNAFLNEWGMQIDSGIVVETDSKSYYYYPYYPISHISDAAYTPKTAQSSAPIVTALSAPLSVVRTTSNYSALPLLSTGTSSAILAADKSVSYPGEKNTMLISEHINYGQETNSSYIVLSGSYQAFSSTLLTDSTFSNAEYLIELLNTLTGRENAVTIAPKDFSVAKHSLNSSEIITRGIVFAVIIPVLVAAAGVYMWIKRKNA